MNQLLSILHVLVCLLLMFLVLIQQGKGAEVGAQFGGGSANTIFGSQGSGNFLTKLTSTLAFLFFITSLSLGIITSRGLQQSGMDLLKAPTVQTKQHNKTPAPAKVSDLPEPLNLKPSKNQ